MGELREGFKTTSTPSFVVELTEPWIGSNMEGYCRVGSRLDDGAIPIDPARAAARSERMSAWTFGSTVSKVSVCS